VWARLLRPLSGAGGRTRNDGVGMVGGATLSAGSAGGRGTTYRGGGLRQGGAVG
jgi:hypothetical protein